MEIREYRNKLEQKKGKLHQIQNDISLTEKEIRQLKKEMINCEEALLIAQTVAQQTQQELEYHISDIVTLALNAVFDEPYEFKVEFVIRRGKTEADLLFLKNDNIIDDPINESGGGAVDVASLALRIALWNLQVPKSRNTLILDEPMKFVSEDLRPKVVSMMKLLSEKLKLQIIMVTHLKELVDGADKVFINTIKKGVSKIT